MKIGIIANAEKDIAYEALALLKAIPGFKIVYIRESDVNLYIVDEKVFNLSRGNQL